MSFVFSLRRAFDRGIPVGSAKSQIEAMGTLVYREASDDRFKRVVRTATFTRTDGGEPVPPLRNADPLLWNGEIFVLTGVEEVTADRMARPQMFGQTWMLRPEALEALMRADQTIARLVYRLRIAGIDVRMQPGGGMRIDGERRADGEPV